MANTLSSVNVGQATVSKASEVAPSSGRFGRIAKMTAGITLAAVLSANALMPGPSLQSAHALSAKLQSVEVVQSQGMKLIEPGKDNVFLNAGFDASGAFSPSQMVDSWRDAGMDAKDAAKALDMVKQVTPTVVKMGGTTGLKDVEGIVNGVSTATTMKMLQTFPEVAQNLKDGVKVEVSSAQHAAWEAFKGSPLLDVGMNKDMVSSSVSQGDAMNAVIDNVAKQKHMDYYHLSLMDMAAGANLMESANRIDRFSPDATVNNYAQLEQGGAPKTMNVAAWRAQLEAAREAASPTVQVARSGPSI